MNQRDAFDMRYGTDTSGIEPIPLRARLFSSAGRSAVHYGTVREDKIRALLEPFPRTATVVDLGCGKGRTLIVAARMGFYTEGVEFNPDLADIARHNIRLCGITRATVVTCDVRNYDFPPGPLVVYMYNPFRGPVMNNVARRLQQRTDETWLVYVNPYDDALFEWMPKLDLTEAQAALFSPGSVSIRHRH